MLNIVHEHHTVVPGGGGWGVMEWRGYEGGWDGAGLGVRWYGGGEQDGVGLSGVVREGGRRWDGVGLRGVVGDGGRGWDGVRLRGVVGEGERDRVRRGRVGVDGRS